MRIYGNCFCFYRHTWTLCMFPEQGRPVTRIKATIIQTQQKQAPMSSSKVLIPSSRNELERLGFRHCLPRMSISKLLRGVAFLLLRKFKVFSGFRKSCLRWLLRERSESGDQNLDSAHRAPGARALVYFLWITPLKKKKRQYRISF